MDASSRNTREATPAERNGALPEKYALDVPAQGYKNPGATPNLRGVEENTAYIKGTVKSSFEGSRDESPKHLGPSGAPYETYPIETVARPQTDVRD